MGKCTYDYDGKSKSEIISVDAKLDAAQILVSITSSSVDLNVFSPNAIEANVYLYDLEGSKISEKKVSLLKGSNVIQLEQSLSPGIYFVSLITEAGTVNSKFAKPN